MTRDEYKRLLEPHLPPPILERAVRNFDGSRLLSYSSWHDLNPYELINYGFSWILSLEGSSFWNGVYDHLAYGRPEELPSVKGLRDLPNP